MKSPMKSPMKNPQESQVTMTEIILPQHANALGSVFGGTVMGWMDIAAAIAAQRHSGQICVTASVDELHFLKPLTVGMVANIQARLTAVNRSSCEVQVEVQGENPRTGQRFNTARAFMTFVAIDTKGNTVAMPALQSLSKEDKHLAEASRQRREHRQKIKKSLQDLAKSSDSRK